MKKKLFFLFAMVATLMCLLAVVSFAATPDTTRETFTLTDGTVLPIWDTDGNGLIWYKSTLNTEDGYANYDYVANTQTDSSIKPYVSYSKGGPYGRAVDGRNYYGYQITAVTVTDDNGSYSSSSSSKHEDFVLINIQNLMFNSNNKVNMFATTFRHCALLEAVYLDKGSDSAPIFILSQSFEYCSKLRYINTESINLIEIGGNGVFNGCTSLTQINLPNTLKVLGHYTFQATGLTEFTFPSSIKKIDGSATFKNCASLENVYGLEALIESRAITGILANMFENCTSLETLFENGVFPEGLSSIGGSAFVGCTSFGPNVILPNSLTSIGQSAFAGCTSLEKVVLGASFTTWSSYDGFKNCSALEEVWMPETMTAIAGNVFNTAASNCVFYFTGTKGQLDNVKANANSNNSAFHNAYNQAKSWDEFQDIETKSGRYIVYGVNECFAFYDNNHTLTGTDCTKDDTCKICVLPIAKQAEHTLLEALVYANGFTENGVYTCDCTFNGCTVVDIKAGDEGSSRAPLFNGGEGFSTKGEDGIAGGYTINVDGVNEYKRINGSLTFGIMVVNPNYYYGKDSFFDTNGKVNTSGGALQVEFTNNQYQNVNVSLTGFAGADDLSLVIALYAYDDAESVEFIQSTTTKCGDKNVTVGGETLYTVTLASVKSGANDLSSLGDYTIEEPQKKEEQA